MADKIELLAVSSAATIHVEFVERDALHLGLHHGAILEILAVCAEAPARFLLGHAPGLCDALPVFLIGVRLDGCLLRAKLPFIDDALAVLAVLSGRYDLLFREAKLDHDFIHWCAPYSVISRPEARIVKVVAALAVVEM